MLNQKIIVLNQKIALKPCWTTRCYSLDCVKMIDRHDNNIPMFIYLLPSKRHNNNREVKIKMLNNTNDDNDNKKLPPIPPYYKQPSRAEWALDEALANSDPFVDKANDCWKDGHRVPAKNPTRYLRAFAYRLVQCGMTGCEVDQMLPQLPCFGFDPKTHSKWIHACCYQKKVLDRYKNSTLTLTNTEKIWNLFQTIFW